MVFGGDFNIWICFICFGLFGVFFVINCCVVELLIVIGFVLNCFIFLVIKWDCKNYFYLDFLKGY